MNKQGFTLIELLVVISIIGILIGLSIFGLQGARESSRDAKRKSDLELIRSGLEIYRSDCGLYPLSSAWNLNGSLVGDDTSINCSASNVYIAEIPQDPIAPAQNYLYSSPTGDDYELCARLEQGEGQVTCGGMESCGETCNYKVVSP